MKKSLRESVSLIIFLCLDNEEDHAKPGVAVRVDRFVNASIQAIKITGRVVVNVLLVAGSTAYSTLDRVSLVVELVNSSVQNEIGGILEVVQVARETYISGTEQTVDLEGTSISWPRPIVFQGGDTSLDALLDVEFIVFNVWRGDWTIVARRKE